MTKLTYRQLKDQLDEVVERLQDPGTDIDEALELHTKAKKLIEKLDTYLSEIETSVKKQK